MTGKNMERLPKWAKQEIEWLQNRVKELEEVVRGDFDQRHISWRDVRLVGGLPPTAEVVFKLSNNPDDVIRVHRREEDGKTVLDLSYGAGQIVVLPHSSNWVKVYGENRLSWRTKP